VDPFRYPPAPIQRRHGPRGYANYESYRPWLRDEFFYRCVYCLLREQWGHVRGTYDLDHFVPLVVTTDESAEYDNLVYACRSCNAAKGKQVVPDPCQVLIDLQVTVEQDGQMIGHTRDARRLIRCLALNNSASVAFRRLWIEVIALAQRYDTDLFERLMGYPNDLPDLSRLRPPGGNSRPDGIAQSHFARREQGKLRSIY
jgi:hypothetical protein